MHNLAFPVCGQVDTYGESGAVSRIWQWSSQPVPKNAATRSMNQYMASPPAA
jgi:hypothetical protein